MARVSQGVYLPQLEQAVFGLIRGFIFIVEYIFAPLRRVISALVFRQMHAQLIGQGIARYPRVQVRD
jgi:hypothetical protein